jgi:hypothetical protein
MHIAQLHPAYDDMDMNTGIHGQLCNVQQSEGICTEAQGQLYRFYRITGI